MGNRNIVNGLALIGAIIVLIGVTVAANTALADDAKGGRAVSVTTESVTNKDKAPADNANREAADAALERLAIDTKLELEIRLADRTSTIVARRL